MSCGVPVITTNGTPWQELNSLGLGWCVDLSVQNIATTLSEAIELGQDKLFSMGQKANLYVNEHYDYIKVAEKTAFLYKRLLSKSITTNFIEL